MSLHTSAVGNPRVPRCASPTQAVCPHLSPGLTAHLMGATDVSCHFPRAGPVGKCSVHRVHHDATKVRMRMVANQQRDSCKNQISDGFLGGFRKGSFWLQDLISDLESLSDHLLSCKSEPSKDSSAPGLVFCVQCSWKWQRKPQSAIQR